MVDLNVKTSKKIKKEKTDQFIGFTCKIITWGNKFSVTEEMTERSD